MEKSELKSKVKAKVLEKSVQKIHDWNLVYFHAFSNNIVLVFQHLGFLLGINFLISFSHPIFMVKTLWLV